MRSRPEGTTGSCAGLERILHPCRSHDSDEAAWFGASLRNGMGNVAREPQQPAGAEFAPRVTNSEGQPTVDHNDDLVLVVVACNGGPPSCTTPSMTATRPSDSAPVTRSERKLLPPMSKTSSDTPA